MVRRSFRFGLRVGVLVGVVLALVKLWQSLQPPEAEGDGWVGANRSWQPPPPARPVDVAVAVPPAGDGSAPSVERDAAPAPPPAKVTAPVKAARPRKSPAKPREAPPRRPARADAADEVRRTWVEPVGTTCPPEHPVKVKLASRLFHVPGMFAYERTRPDRCYANDEEAAADGFSRAKR